METDIEPMGESALLLRLGTHVDADVNARVHAAARLLLEAELPAVQEIVPAYASLLVRLDLDALRKRDIPVDEMARRVRETLSGMPDAAEAASGSVHRIPVCYEGDLGPDLEHVAHVTGLTREQVIALHAGVEYRVAMIGFAPGFAYLLGMDERLHVPRREQPRTRVPRGSVAIGGAQTGVYPSELPGGWQLIGRTPSLLFDARSSVTPCLLAPGDRVRFEPVDAAEFEARLEEGAAS
jgi:KipI family sensor histidine kinase inhibitor